MKILFIGDVFGETGIRALENVLPKYIKENKIDFTIANCENVTQCRGLSVGDYQSIKKCGVNFITMGNHTWKQPDIKSVLANDDIIRPYNITGPITRDDSKGYRIISINNKKVRIINLMATSIYFSLGRITNPFICLEEILNTDEEVDINIVDFHSETTSEKNCLLRSFSGKLSLIVGTHTHVQTNDAHIFNDTAYISDLGMTGPSEGVIGADPQPLIEMFFNRSNRFCLKENFGKYQFCGAEIEFDDKTNKPKDIKNVFIRE